jgi:hypothetical protein
MRFLRRSARTAAALAVAMLASSCLSPVTADQSGPQAAVKVINLLQGVDNASIGFETGRPLSVIAYPSIAPTENGSYFFVSAAGPRQLRVLLTTSTVLDSTVTFTPQQYYTIVTTGTRGATGAGAPGYLVLLNNMSPVATGQIRLRFIHGASSVGAVDVYNTADTSTFTPASRLFQGVPYRGSMTIESPTAGNRGLCVIASGTVPTANGSNCLALRLYGVGGGAGLTAALREPTASETAPAILFTLDRTP